MTHQIYDNIVIKIRWWRNLKLILYPKTASSRCIYVEGFYEPNEFYFLDKFLKSGMVFIDIGANNGWFGVFASKKVGSEGMVYSVEPSQREIDKINKNIELNNLTNIKVLECALLDKEGFMDLLIAEDKNDGHNTFGNFIYETDLKTKEKVRVDILDNLVKKENIKRIDFIKIDAEGSELFILKSSIEAIKSFQPVMLIEIAELSLKNQGSRSADIYTFLGNLGYQFYTFSKDYGLLEPFLSPDKPANSKSSFNLIAVPAGTKINY